MEPVEVVRILRDNPFMHRPSALRPLVLVTLIAALAAGGCGWAEWPPPSRAHAITPPPRPAVRVAPAPQPDGGERRGSDMAFVGAQSVIAGPGDTVYGLSQRHGVSPRAIIEANGLTPPYQLVPGRRVVLPRDRVHVVARGDTLYGISRRYGVDMYELARNNRLEPPYTILVGQELRVPAAFSERAPTGPSPPSAVETTDLPAPSATPSTAGAPPGPPAAAPSGPAVTMTAPAVPPPPPAPVSEPPPPTGKGFIWPTDGKVVLGYGPKAKGLHNDGINIAAPQGAPVRAAENGVVAYAGNEIRGFGNLLLIKHADGWITAYAHNEELLVKRGEAIKKGQIIARVGTTGNVTSPQLHFEMRRGRQAVDPIRYLSGKQVSLGG